MKVNYSVKTMRLVSSPEPTAIATYCLPSIMYVMGVPPVRTLVSYRQRSAAVLLVERVEGGVAPTDKDKTCLGHDGSLRAYSTKLTWAA